MTLADTLEMEHPTQPRSASNDCKTVYADVLGQEGVTTRQLIKHPPEGYRIITRRKATNTIAEFQQGKPSMRSVRRAVHRFVPVNLAMQYFLAGQMAPPPGTDLTYLESTVSFRREPWVLWLEVANQMAGHNGRLLRRFRKAIERALASDSCRAVICHTEACKASVMNALDGEHFANKLHVVHSGWPLLPAVAPRGADDRPVRILFVGASRASYQFRIKGGWEALEAFVALRQRFPGLELIIRSDVDAEVRRKYDGLPGLRIVDHPIERAELDGLFRSSDIFWFPAHTLISVSVLEAMSYGLPVVASDYFDIPEYVEDGRTGIVIPHHRHIPSWETSEREVRKALDRNDREFVQSLIATTSVLIENPIVRRRMGMAGRAAIASRFSLAEKNRKTKAVFDHATAPPLVARAARTGS